MTMAPRLILGQRQALVMTPQLQQAIKLLQLSQLDLAQYVESELERNPLLQRADEDGRAADEEAQQAFSALSASWRDGRSESGGRLRDDMEAAQSVAETIGMREYLASQALLEFAVPAERIIAAHAIDLIDDAGYLATPAAAMADYLGATVAQVEAVLARLKKFDPPGIFAANLAECLGLQLAERGRLDAGMRRLLENLDLLGRRDLAGLTRRCGVDGDVLAGMIGELRTLDPKPGLRFDASPVQPVVPDIFVRPRQGGGWLIELNGEVLPRVLVNRQYSATIVAGARNRAEKEYISERLQAANWLVKALDQRANTILRVAREIVRRQEEFLRQGVRALKPMILRDVAEAVELHESTVSRVTSNKFMVTPRGIFELKYFFSAALPTGGEDAVTGAAVRDRIKELIEAEPAGAPFSDDRVVEMLRGEGVSIARRTVAKYRDLLRIPSSARRRREQAFNLLGSATPP